jgi:hypothetical protein
MLNEGSYDDDDGCSLRMWNVRRTMAREEWDLKIAWGNGMDMGTGMETRLNQILNNV